MHVPVHSPVHQNVPAAPVRHLPPGDSAGFICLRADCRTGEEAGPTGAEEEPKVEVDHLAPS